MSKRAEERALEFYPMKDYNKEPNYIHSCDSKTLDVVYREVFRLGYLQAEKDLGWISVKDRLPEEPGWYLTCYDLNGIAQGICLSFYEPDTQSWLDEEEIECAISVDYWMEVPKFNK